MPTTVQFLEADRVVESVYSGVVNHDEMVATAMRAIALAGERSSFRFLTDLTALNVGPTVTDLLAAVEQYSAVGLPRTMREALIASPRANDPREVQFYADACQNRGWNSRIFTDRVSGMAFLTS